MAPRQRCSSPQTSELSVERVPPMDETASNSKGGSSSNDAVVKPTVRETEADIAREQHDFFNLFALLFVIGTSLVNWDYRKLMQGYGPAEAWTGNHFYLNWATTILYFFIDLMWVSRIPICVKSPGIIVKHHAVAIAYLSAPLHWSEFRWFMGACLTVEVNTWFLILRRVLYKRRESIQSPLLQEVVSAFFYTSWIIVRCFIYPAILFVFLQMAHLKVLETNVLWHWPMLFIPVHFFLCILNLKWSYDLFQPMVQKWLAKDADGAAAISSGL
ncbi:hypothetical protein MPSEU_000890200 [Mayamaea pseudoterrestris]|nr:hypothetical protein MPSEU_000890200 [Mayamaea pseudoterrestris]